MLCPPRLTRQLITTGREGPCVKPSDGAPATMCSSPYLLCPGRSHCSQEVGSVLGAGSDNSPLPSRSRRVCPAFSSKSFKFRVYACGLWGSAQEPDGWAAAWEPRVPSAGGVRGGWGESSLGADVAQSECFLLSRLQWGLEPTQGKLAPAGQAPF